MFALQEDEWSGGGQLQSAKYLRMPIICKWAVFPGWRVKCSLCPGTPPVGHLYENIMFSSCESSNETNAFLVLTLSPTSPNLLFRTWGNVKKLTSRVQSIHSTGSSPGLAWLPDHPPVLLAQFIESQPESTTRLKPYTALEFSGAFLEERHWQTNT